MCHPGRQGFFWSMRHAVLFIADHRHMQHSTATGTDLLSLDNSISRRALFSYPRQFNTTTDAVPLPPQQFNITMVAGPRGARLPLRSPLNERNSAGGGHGGRASRHAGNPALYCKWPEPLNAADMARRVVCAWPTEADAATFRAPGGNRKKTRIDVYWMMFQHCDIPSSTW